MPVPGVLSKSTKLRTSSVLIGSMRMPVRKPWCCTTRGHHKTCSLGKSTLPQVNMEAPRTPSDLVPFKDPKWGSWGRTSMNMPSFLLVAFRGEKNYQGLLGARLGRTRFPLGSFFHRRRAREARRRTSGAGARGVRRVRHEQRAAPARGAAQRGGCGGAWGKKYPCGRQGKEGVQRFQFQFQDLIIDLFSRVTC